MQPYWRESKQTLYSSGDISHLDGELEDDTHGVGYEDRGRPPVVSPRPLDAEGNRLVPVGSLFLFAFFLEILTVLSLGVLAYYLRFTDQFPVYERLFSCLDVSIYQPYYSEEDQGPSLVHLTSKVFYGLCLGIPIGVVILGEVGNQLFASQRPQKVLVTQLNFKIALFLRRITRFIGMFVLGIFLTTIFTHCVKILTGRHRPHFITVCEPAECQGLVFLNSSSCQLNSSDVIREAKLAFPSFHAAVAMFCALYAVLYLHNLLSVRGTYTLCPVLVTTLMLLALIPGYHRLATNWSHWEDVLVGYIIGAAISSYMVFWILHNFKESYPLKCTTASAVHLISSREKDYIGSTGDPSNPNRIPWFLRWRWIPRAVFKENTVTQAVNEGIENDSQSCMNYAPNRQPIYAYAQNDSKHEMGPKRYYGHQDSSPITEERGRVNSRIPEASNPPLRKTSVSPFGLYLCENGHMKNENCELVRGTRNDDSPPRFLRKDTMTDRF